MYTPLQLQPNQRQGGSVSSLLSERGINLKDLPQLLDSKYAQNIENWLIDASGKLIKRKGLTQLFTVAGTDPITMLKQFTSDIIMFAYGKKLAAYTISTDTVTAVHTFTGAGDATGAVVGDNFFVCNGTERVAYVTTALVYALVADATAPLATVLYAASGRLFAGVGNTIYWSASDDGSAVPFNGGTDWTAGTAADDANFASYRNAGTIRAITTLGQQIVAFYDNGKVGFRISSLDVGGTLVQDTLTDFQRIDFGAVRGAVYTQKGIFYANENGVYQLVSGGNTDQPYSEKDDDISTVFGKDFIDDIDFDNSDLIHVPSESLILVTCAQDSSTNNLILWFNTDTRAWGKIKGWNISRFMYYNGTTYGGSATGTTVNTLFTGNSDNGTQIRCNYTQELNLKDLQNIKSLENFYIQGKLSPSSSITIYFDIYDREGRLNSPKKTITWTTSGIGDAVGMGSEPFGGAWGDSGDESGLISSFAQTKNARINEFLRISVRIIVSDTLPCEINWFSCNYKIKFPARTNNLTVT